MRLLAAPFPVDAVGTILKISRPCTAHSTVDPGHSHIRLPYCRSQICLMTVPVRRSVHLMTGSQVEHPVFSVRDALPASKGAEVFSPQMEAAPCRIQSLEYLTIRMTSLQALEQTFSRFLYRSPKYKKRIQTCRISDPVQIHIRCRISFSIYPVYRHDAVFRLCNTRFPFCHRKHSCTQTEKNPCAITSINTIIGIQSICVK